MSSFCYLLDWKFSKSLSLCWGNWPEHWQEVSRAPETWEYNTGHSNVSNWQGQRPGLLSGQTPADPLYLVCRFVCVCLFVHFFFREKQTKVSFSHENYNPEEKHNWRKYVHHCGGIFSFGKYICPRHKLTKTSRFNSKSVKMIHHLSFIKMPFSTQNNNNA